MIVALRNMSATNKVVFLDRDGVVNHDPGDYTASVDEFRFLPGVLDTLKSWTEMGFSFIVITNQGGIARGRYTLEDFSRIDKKMSDAFRDSGIAYLETYYCTHHDLVGKCLCRKPLPGMLEKAIARHKVDRRHAFMIGDKDRDVAAAEAAGIRGVKIPTNGGLATIDPNEVIR